LIADGGIAGDIGIILDTGATRSITNHSAMLKDLKKEEVEIVQLDGSMIRSQGTGTLVFETIATDGEIITVEVKDALFIEEASATLISWNQLQSQGCTMHPNGQRFILKDRHGVEIALRKSHGLQCFPEPEAAGAAMVGVEEKVPPLHARFGHLGAKRLEKTLKATKHTFGKTGKAVVVDDCEPCIAGKFERTPAPRGPHEPYANEPCEICAIDVSGPHVGAIAGNYTHSLVCVDLVSKVTGVYPMHGITSEEVLRAFNEWVADWIGTSNAPIRVVHDNATYFLGGAFKEARLQRGWLMRLTPAHRHEGNPAESIIKQLIYTSRTMLIAVGLPETFWPYAFTTASYLRNRVVASRADRTPYEEHTGVQPSVDHLRVFGCKVYVKDNRQGSDQRYTRKLKPTARAGIFVGYEGRAEHGVYRVLFPGEKSVTRTRDVKFLESTFWTWNEDDQQEATDAEWSGSEDSCSEDEEYTPHADDQENHAADQEQEAQEEHGAQDAPTQALQNSGGAAASENSGGAQDGEQSQKRNRKKRTTFNIESTSGKTYDSGSALMAMLAREEQQIADAESDSEDSAAGRARRVYVTEQVAERITTPVHYRDLSRLEQTSALGEKNVDAVDGREI